MGIPRQFRVPGNVIPGVLIVYSVLWFVAALAFYLANRQSKDGWSAAPVAVMWLLLLLPLLEATLAVSLVGARRARKERLSVLDFFAIGAAAAPFVLGGILVLIVVWGR